jgi:NADH-quinone oxidoreductase subunit J
MLWVLALFLHVAGIFLLLGAEFVAAVQVVVYAGAILIFYLFMVMLLDLPNEEARPRFGSHWPFAGLVGLGLGACSLVGLVFCSFFDHEFLGFASAGAGADPTPHDDNLAKIGRELFGRFALPFEIASLVLLAAIIGAVVLARRREVRT